MTLWFYSDPHGDHESLVRGSVKHPVPARKGYDSAAQMWEAFVEAHNKVVKPSDHSYCLGDFTMGKELIVPYAKMLNGHRRIILGNHDVHPMKLYQEAFGKVCAMREFAGMMFTHLPIAPWSAGRWRANVHGHCHDAKPLFYTASNPDQYGFVKSVQYINISLENIHYRPISLEQIESWVQSSHTAGGVK